MPQDLRDGERLNEERPDRVVGAALLSQDLRYRYWLTRDWGRGARTTFIMLNPSTADGTADDATIRKCIGFARRWNTTGIMVVNLYAFRARHPADMWAADDPVGPGNDSYILQAAREAASHDAPVVAAWGANEPGPRGRAVLAALADQGLPVQCLGKSKAGQPLHPLMLSYSTALVPAH